MSGAKIETYGKACLQQPSNAHTQLCAKSLKICRRCALKFVLKSEQNQRFFPEDALAV